MTSQIVHVFDISGKLRGDFVKPVQEIKILVELVGFPEENINT